MSAARRPRARGSFNRPDFFQGGSGAAPARGEVFPDRCFRLGHFLYRPRTRGSFLPVLHARAAGRMPPPRAGKFPPGQDVNDLAENTAPTRGEVSLLPRGPLYNRLYIQQRYAIIEKTLKKAQRNHSRHGEVSFPPPRRRKTSRSGTKHSFSKSRTFHRDLE